MGLVKYNSESEWHAIRKQNIGSSEVAALLNIEGAFTTRFQLWLEKSGKMDIPFEENERMRWGKRLERVIAEGVCEQEGFQLIMPEGYYLHDRVKGMGASPDFFIKSPDRNGLGVLEIKLIDYASYAREWIDGEPPLKYIIQLQEQFACTNTEWGVVAPFINGNTLKIFPYDRHDKTISIMEKAVEQFWDEVASGVEPKAIADDYEIVKDYYAVNDGEVIDLSSDNILPELCQLALDSAEIRLNAEKREKAAKAEIIQKIGTASFATINGYTVSRKQIVSNIKAVEAHIRTSERLTIREKSL